MFSSKCSVYIIESTSGHYKIGISRNPKNRLKQLKMTQGPYKYSLAFFWWCGSREEARFIESDLHRIHGKRRVNGEWFELTANDLIGIGQCFELIRDRYLERKS